MQNAENDIEKFTLVNQQGEESGTEASSIPCPHIYITMEGSVAKTCGAGLIG
jgi:hypothetical protein